MTGAEGHTPLPVNRSWTVTLVSSKRNTTGWYYYNWTITATKSGYTSNSTTITPDSSWYRPDPNTYQNTTLIILQSSSNQTLDNNPNQFWVRTDGNDTCNGQNNVSYSDNSTDCAWLTIQKAADTLTGGQTVRVQSGTYSESDVTELTSNVTYIGDNYPLFNGSSYSLPCFRIGNYQSTNYANYVTIQGFNFTGCKRAIANQGNYSTYKNNHFFDYDMESAIWLWRSSHVWVENNTAYIKNYGVRITNGNAREDMVENITIYNNTLGSDWTTQSTSHYPIEIDAYIEVAGDMIWQTGAKGINISYNNITGAGWSGIQGGIAESWIGYNTIRNTQHNGIDLHGSRNTVVIGNNIEEGHSRIF